MRPMAGRRVFLYLEIDWKIEKRWKVKAWSVEDAREVRDFCVELLEIFTSFYFSLSQRVNL